MTVTHPVDSGLDLQVVRRHRLAMTQQELADAVGLSRVAVGLMERGRAPIEKRTALAVEALQWRKAAGS